MRVFIYEKTYLSPTSCSAAVRVEVAKVVAALFTARVLLPCLGMKTVGNDRWKASLLSLPRKRYDIIRNENDIYIMVILETKLYDREHIDNE